MHRPDQQGSQHDADQAARNDGLDRPPALAADHLGRHPDMHRPARYGRGRIGPEHGHPVERPPVIDGRPGPARAGLHHRVRGGPADMALMLLAAGHDQPLPVHHHRDPAGGQLGRPQHRQERLRRQKCRQHVADLAVAQHGDPHRHARTWDIGPRCHDARHHRAAGAEHFREGARLDRPDGWRPGWCRHVQDLPAVPVQDDDIEPGGPGRQHPAELLMEGRDVPLVQLGRYGQGAEHADIGVELAVDQGGRARGDLHPQPIDRGPLLPGHVPDERAGAQGERQHRCHHERDQAETVLAPQRAPPTASRHGLRDSIPTLACPRIASIWRAGTSG